MSDLPVAHRLLRSAWGILPLSVLAVCAALLLLWAFSHGNGDHLVSSWWNASVHAQRAMARAIPFPWG